ncbi:arginyl tRNA synthetase cytoplasmic [Echinococcus multilocularis]|uniref:arginine--tRNA ligase n=1 Tax=Echinococcus multilocularis TaxID=6211 RepID=A0A068XVN0_ECHMU|nr:arginyl tRNA synthetase cytoplasmic [Echinococcus multilocularis]
MHCLNKPLVGFIAIAGFVMLKQVDGLATGLEEVINRPRFKELSHLFQEHSKLTYQKEQLEKAIDNLQKTLMSHQVSILNALIATFDLATKKAFPQLTSVSTVVTPSSHPNFGDYQCNNGLSLARQLSADGTKISPVDVATKICDHLVEGSLVEKVDIAGRGFINIFISRNFVEEEVTKIVGLGFSLPPPQRRLKCIVDMSSPNIAKEMHVGHLRSTIIGESVSRLLKFMGHDVLKLNHLGDWGTQFGMLIVHLKDTFEDLGDRPLPITDLQKFYQEAKVRFDKDEDFKRRSYDAVVKLQSYDPEHIKNWEKICDVSKLEFDDIYCRLDIKNLVPRGESFYQSRMIGLVEYLDERGLLEFDDGRKIMWAPGSSVPLTIVKSDGGFTYDTSDLTAVRQRVVEEGGERIIYVVDSGQSLHLQNIFSAAQASGLADPARTKLEHIPFGVVLGEDKKKFKTRSGETVKLVDLLNEGVDRVKKKLAEKGRDKELTPEEQWIAAEAIAYGCIKYADLSHNRINDYIFSFDKMLDDKGNTAAYLLYAYTRIQSIVRNTGWSKEKLAEVHKTAHINLEHPKELKLGKMLCRLPEVLIKLEEDLFFNKLCDYLYELSGVFTEFYDSCYCIERENGKIVKIHESRILLCEATAAIMKTCFDILGIRTVEKM